MPVIWRYMWCACTTPMSASFFIGCHQLIVGILAFHHFIHASRSTLHRAWNIDGRPVLVTPSQCTFPLLFGEPVTSFFNIKFRRRWSTRLARLIRLVGAKEPRCSSGQTCNSRAHSMAVTLGFRLWCSIVFLILFVVKFGINTFAVTMVDHVAMIILVGINCIMIVS